MPEELSVPQVAKHLRVSEETVRRNIRSMRLRATRRGRQWFVTRDDLMEFSNVYDSRTGRVSRMPGVRVQRFGLIPLVAGAAVLVGYGAYELVRELFTADVPLVVSIGVVVAAVGFLILLLGVGIERWRTSREEDLNEVEP